MDRKLASIRKIGNITCRTANEIVLDLESLKNTSDELFS